MKPLLALFFLLMVSWQDRPVTVMVFGDSIAAGYGIDPEQAFPALLQGIAVDAGFEVQVINAGLSGETSAGGLRRIDWVLQRPVDIFMLELGGNDGLRGIDPSNTKQNLVGIIQKVRDKNPGVEIILTGMEAPPNLGDDYTTRFRMLYREIAESEGVKLMPFILEGVAGIPELNLADGIHPTPEGHEIIASNLWAYLKPILEKTASGE